MSSKNVAALLNVLFIILYIFSKDESCFIAAVIYSAVYLLLDGKDE